MKIILVTGAAGFIGFHVSKNLLKKNYKVIRFVHPKSIRGIFKHKNYHELTTLNESEKIL